MCLISLGRRERWKLEISTARNFQPAASISCRSMPRWAPTNNISLVGRRSLISPARASAGFTCPAVPPQVKITLMGKRPFLAFYIMPGQARYFAFGAGICRDTESTMPTSASWMARAVPP